MKIRQSQRATDRETEGKRKKSYRYQKDGGDVGKKSKRVVLGERMSK